MSKIFFLALLAFCNPFEVLCNKKYAFHYNGTVKMNETDELCKYDLKTVEKVGDTQFKVDCDIDLFTALDNEWHMWIKAYYNPECNGEYNKLFIATPKQGLCDFMKKTYRERFYEQIKNYSNFPHPDTCPVTAGRYTINNFVFDGSRYATIGRPGCWKVDLFLSQDQQDSHVTKMGVSIYGTVSEIEGSDSDS